MVLSVYGSKFLFEGLFDAGDFGRDIGDSESEDVGDFLLAVSFEIKENHSPVDFFQFSDEFLKHIKVFILFDREFFGRKGNNFLRKWLADPTPSAFFSVKRNGHIERNSVHPGTQLETRVIFGKAEPQLQNDLLDQVFAVFFIPTIGVGDLVDDAFVGIYDFQK
jgi:hypothetical protein